MYNDTREYLQFLLDNQFLIATEPLQQSDRLPVSVLNHNLNWQTISDEYRANKVVIVDDFLNVEFANRLRNFVLFLNVREDYYPDYAALNFYRSVQSRLWFPILTNIVEECKERMSFLSDLEFERAWAFIYENSSNGVPAHADPAATNLNLWVTPNECMELESNTNGLDIWKIYPPDSWEYDKYNGDVDAIESFLSEHDAEKINVEYKFNRVTIFDSKFFHKTQPVKSKSGYANRRINYTFLYR